MNCILLNKLESFIGISTTEKNHTSTYEKLCRHVTILFSPMNEIGMLNTGDVPRLNQKMFIKNCNITVETIVYHQKMFIKNCNVTVETIVT